MSRFFYRSLIWLHPRAFRERFGDEMLCVFDEVAHTSTALFFADGFLSLARQWLLRSGLWRLAVGATATALLLVGYAHSEANWQRKQMIAQELAEAKRVPPLDHAEFNREAAQAVAILARYRESAQKKSHLQHSQRQKAAANQD